MNTRTARQIWIVFRKEIREALRDRRAMTSILFSVIVGPSVLGFMLKTMADRQRQAEEVTIAIVGIENAPALVDWLRQQAGVTVERGPADPEKAVRDETHDLVVVIPREFQERFRASKAAPVRMVVDGSRNASRPTAQRVRALFQAYGAQIGALRLIDRGISPGVATALDVKEVEVSTARQRAAQAMNIFATFLLMAGLLGGMQIAIDSTAGERERGSFEPLLVNPAPRGALVMGKWLAALSASITSVLLTALLCGVLGTVLLKDLDVSFQLSPPLLVTLVLVTLPMCAFAAALETSIGTLSRSFMEAQSYAVVLISLPTTVLVVFSTMYSFVNQSWMYAVPILGQYVLATNLLRGTPPGPAAFATSMLVTLVCAAVLVNVVTRMFRSEKIIFAR